MEKMTQKQTHDERETLMRIAEELGLECVTAHNCIDAIRKLKSLADGRGVVNQSARQRGFDDAEASL